MNDDAIVIKAANLGCRSTSVGFGDKLNPLDDDFTIAKLRGF